MRTRGWRVHLSRLPHSRPALISSRSSRRHVGKSVTSRRKWECLESLAWLLTILARECECLHSCRLCLVYIVPKVSTSTRDENVNQALMCHICLILAHTFYCAGRYVIFIFYFFSFWCIRLIRISYLNTILFIFNSGNFTHIIMQCYHNNKSKKWILSFWRTYSGMIPSTLNSSDGSQSIGLSIVW